MLLGRRDVCHQPRQVQCHRHGVHLPVKAAVQPSWTVAPPTEPRRLFIWGVGYTTLGLGNLAEKQGWEIIATCRSPESQAALQKLKPSWQLLPFDPCSKPGFFSDELFESLSGCSHVISSIPPLGFPSYDPVVRTQISAIKACGILNEAKPVLKWLGYLSSTGVYGNWDGGWVDEESECRSESARGLIRAAHEAKWAAAAAQQKLPLHIFRLGGIYGPGRSMLETLNRQGDTSSSPAEQLQGPAAASTGSREQGSSSTGPADTSSSSSSSSSKERRQRQKYTSRCHVQDICCVLLASMASPTPPPAPPAPAGPGSPQLPPGMAPGMGAMPGMMPGWPPQAPSGPFAPEPPVYERVAVFNVVDDDPAPRSEVAAYTRSLMAKHPHKPVAGSSAQGDSSSSGKAPGQSKEQGSEALEEKRVRNSRIKQVLGVQLQYPSYREGMAAIVAGAETPFLPGDLEYLGLRGKA